MVTNEYLVNNEQKMDRMAEIDELINNEQNELKIEKLNEEWTSLNDSLITTEELFCMVCDMYNNVYYGQDGNGYYMTGSEMYIDYIYGEDEETGEDVVIKYMCEEKDGQLIKAWEK
jgi:hypothetical protein